MPRFVSSGNVAFDAAASAESEIERRAEAFTAYVPTGKGPVFMQRIERAFGRDVATRTLDTVARCAAA